MPPEIEHVAVAHSFHQTLIVSAGAPSATPSQDVRFRSKAFAFHTPSQFTHQLLTSRLRGRDLLLVETALEHRMGLAHEDMRRHLVLGAA